MGVPVVEKQAGPTAFSDWAQQIRRIHRCRICGNPRLRPVIDLGAQALASLFDDGNPHNQLRTPIPLAVVRCDPDQTEEACRFVQLTHTVPPRVLYHDYGYRSSINTTMRRHLQELAYEIEARVALKSGDIVVDIGANDGVTLLAYRSPGIVRVGFEPSNIRPEGTQEELIYFPTFFNAPDFQVRFPTRAAKVITSIAMFYDLDDPLQFCRSVYELLAEDGLWVVEMSYLGAMLDHNTFDAICHEHLGYYSLLTFQYVVQRAGFAVEDIAFNQANGGSVRCYLRKPQAPTPVPAAHSRRIQQALRDEVEQGYHDQKTYEQFRHRVEGIRDTLRRHLEQFRLSGKRVFGYCASTKGNVLLQYSGIGPGHLVAIADRNPAKVGRSTLGTRIRICSEEDMRKVQPDYLVILAWHFLNEFMERERSLRAAGTRFIVPFPDVRIV